MNILICGHQGFLGSALTSLLKDKYNIYGWGRNDDIAKLDKVYLKKYKIDYVINLVTYIDRSHNKFCLDSLSTEINVDSYRKLINVLSGSDIPIIQISTKDVFGNIYKKDDLIIDKSNTLSTPKYLIDDINPFNPETEYAKSKLIAEFITEHASKFIIIRLNTIYTCMPHKNQNWLQKICDQILLNETVTLTNDGLTFRDPLHVNDLAALLILCIEGKNWNIKLNAGGGEKNLLNLNQVYRIIFKEVQMYRKVDRKINFISSPDYGFAFNNNIANTVFNWTPKKLFSEEIKKYIDRKISE
jgi:nucleoside-diphosphate-sugar epimerase